MTYVLVWLAVTATAVFIAAAAVGSVRDQVTETPTAMVPTTPTTAVATSEASVPTTAADTSSSTTTTTTTTPSASSTTTTTTTPSEPASTTTTTSAPATTTTTVPSPIGIRSYDLIGGVVTVEIGSSTVHLAGASPKSGFHMEVENSGPTKIEVEFKSDEHESKFSGEFKDGTFVHEIEENDREEHDD